MFSVQTVNNVPNIAQNLPVGARLNYFGKTWATLGASSKVIRSLKEGSTLPFQNWQTLTRLNLLTADETTEATLNIFSSCERSKRELATFPTSLPPVEEINARWKALENKAEGNLFSEDAEKLHSTPYNNIPR